MIKSSYKVLGVMSGTSLDGVDLALIHFNYDNQWRFKLDVCKTIPYPENWKEKLTDLVRVSKTNLNKIDSEYTHYLAEIVALFLKENQITNLDFISSHGHTAWHRPDQGVTIQIGNKKVLANLLNITVVCDFRVQDVLLGGQGAPLVPIGDELLFSDYDYCLNLGGFANISLKSAGKRIAYDVCPANIVLNHYAAQLGYNYDKDGEIARTGFVNSNLLLALNNLDYYKENYPKSLGLEWVYNHIFPLINSYNLSVQDVLKTFVYHVAIQITNQINEGTVLITGGGALNNFLISTIKKHGTNQIIIPDNKLLEFKEALIFGFLGVLRIRNAINCLSSVTGAQKNHSSGKIYQA